MKNNYINRFQREADGDNGPHFMGPQTQPTQQPKTKQEWKDSELAKTYEEMKAKFDRLDELEKQVGELPEGVHPDERKPRGETWLQERANWQSEVEALREKVKEQELIIYGLEEGCDEWKLKCSDLEKDLTQHPVSAEEILNKHCAFEILGYFGDRDTENIIAAMVEMYQAAANKSEQRIIALQEREHELMLRASANPSEWEKALVSLTPGGSEYVGDPQRCVEVVREYRDLQHKQIVKLTKELKAAAPTAIPDDWKERVAEQITNELLSLQTESGQSKLTTDQCDMLAESILENVVLPLVAPHKEANP